MVLECAESKMHQTTNTALNTQRVAWDSRSSTGYRALVEIGLLPLPEDCHPWQSPPHLQFALIQTEARTRTWPLSMGFPCYVGTLKFRRSVHIQCVHCTLKFAGSASSLALAFNVTLNVDLVFWEARSHFQTSLARLLTVQGGAGGLTHYCRILNVSLTSNCMQHHLANQKNNLKLTQQLYFQSPCQKYILCFCCFYFFMCRILSSV